MRAGLSGVALWALVLVFSGCGAAETEVSSDFQSEMDAGPTVGLSVEEPLEPTAEPQPVEAPLPPRPGTLSRVELDEVLARGPGSLLREVQINAVFKDKVFVGFQITGFTQGQPSAIDLRIGDVVLGVNGHKVERPEEYYAIFQALKKASELRFDILRDGQRQTLSYPIVD